MVSTVSHYFYERPCSVTEVRSVAPVSQRIPANPMWELVSLVQSEARVTGCPGAPPSVHRMRQLHGLCGYPDPDCLNVKAISNHKTMIKHFCVVVLSEPVAVQVTINVDHVDIWEAVSGFSRFSNSWVADDSRVRTMALFNYRVNIIDMPL